MKVLGRWWARAVAPVGGAGATAAPGSARGEQAPEVRREVRNTKVAQQRRDAPPRNPRDEDDDFDGNFWGW